MSNKNTTSEETYQDDTITLEQAMKDAIANCSMCGTELEFSHAVDFLSLMVKEKSKCPCCGIQSREKEHRIH